MILGIGVDIAETGRFQQLYERYGERIVRRILTERERDEFVRRNQAPAFLATRFAAKEAAVKALGCGFANGVWFKSIEINNNKDGVPQITFFHRAAEIAAQKQVKNIFISLSDEKYYAVAMVVLES